jgi:carbon monoxide dehydrogenase subunit G
MYPKFIAMKYTLEIEIDLPRDRVIALFDNPNNLSKWQEGFESLTTISGNEGEVGTQSELKYNIKGREMVLTETILKKDLPRQYDFKFEGKGVYNIIENSFEELGDNKTKWTSINEFQTKGFLRVLAFLMPGSFKRQSFKYMEDFKKFTENEVD